MAEAVAMKVETEEERVALRAVIARGIDPGRWKECPCGWFYSEARCPDKKCVQWKKANGTKRIKLYAHADKDGGFQTGTELGFVADALRRFAGWGYELSFDADVDLETGEVTLVTVNGHKISPTKG